MLETIIYGRHPVIDALQSGSRFEKIWLQQGVRGEFEKELRTLCRQNGVHMQVVPKERLARLVRGNHQGVIGQLALISYYKIEDVLPALYEQAKTPHILVLDSVTDVRNLGAIARSAEVFGVHALVLPQKGGALVNGEALKTSAGALTKLTVCREKSLVNAVELMRNSGLQIAATTLEGAIVPAAIDFNVPTAIILGSEDKGIRHSLLKMADVYVKIPQLGTTDSLNVSVAAGVLLYEVVRQRRKL